MALALNDRVQQTGTANTTVSFTLSGSVTGFQSFAVVGNGNTTYYGATDSSGNWEVGLGTYSTTGPTLTRTTILASSNSGSAVTFSGTVNVFVTYPAEKSINQDASGNVVLASSTATNYLQAASAATTVAPVLSAVGSDTNIPLVLQPKGTGALQAQQTDSTATGGNARGANAVDWQTSRSSASKVASGQYAFIGGGNGNTASGYNSSVSSGENNNASGYISSVNGGSTNIASGQYSFSGGGYINTASANNSSVVGGYGNSSGGYYNFIGGGYTNSGTSGSAVTTQSGTMNGTTAVTLSGSNASIKVGQLITGTSINNFPHTYVAAISGTSLTLSQNASGSSTSTLSFYTPHGVVVGGGNNQATGSYSFVGGGGDAGTAANGNTASGDWSFVGGGQKNTASGLQSSVIGGYNNTASGTASFVGAGYANISTALGSGILAGVGHTNNGGYAAVVSGANGTTRGLSAFTVFSASAPFSSNVGVSQAGIAVLGVQTTDATATVLRIDGAAASNYNQVILPNNSAYYFRGSIIAGVTGAGNSSAWSFEGAIKRGANAASTVLVNTTPVLNLIAQDSGASTWAVSITADTTNGGLAITVTGQAATTIRWVCRVDTTEMTF